MATKYDKMITGLLSPILVMLILKWSMDLGLGLTEDQAIAISAWAIPLVTGGLVWLVPNKQ